MKPTRQHILDHALRLFNERGFVNVRLQQMADAAFVSVGHLAYHFKNKDTIVEALFDQLQERQETLLNEFRVLPLFEDLERYLCELYKVQQQYIFFYLDRLEVWRAYPVLQQRYRQHVDWQCQQWMGLVDFTISRSSMQVINESLRWHLVWQLQAITDHWRYICQSGSTADSESAFLSHVWAILEPWLTNMGERELSQLRAWRKENG